MEVRDKLQEYFLHLCVSWYVQEYCKYEQGDLGIILFRFLLVEKGVILFQRESHHAMINVVSSYDLSLLRTIILTFFVWVLKISC